MARKVRFAKVLGLLVFACVGVGIEAFRDRHYVIGVVAFLIAAIFIWDSWPKKRKR